MLRRIFIAGVAATGALSSFSLGTNAQQPAASRPRVGVLIYGSLERNPNTQALLEGLRQNGYVDGQNLTIEYRYAQGRAERLPALAAELVQSKPAVIIALGGDVVPHVTKATQSIPIIYAMSADPVQLGIARSLAGPGGNATGVTFLSDHLAAKRLEILKEAAPRIARVALVRDPGHRDNELPVAERAAKSLGLELIPVDIRDPAELDQTLETARKADIDSLYVVSSRHTDANAPRIVEFANRHRLPMVAGWGAWVQAGGLISYGPNVGEMVRQASRYLEPVLKGANPGELPVQQPTRFELFVNLRTAKALGLNISEAFLLRADKVVE
ncbi:ABC transporter substrate-binding protein [Bradyrhizobium sp. OAE829]|uniref:ABC transporter substrate-binding protein n=1 Tax=Bradyrhizobium sp. OAE829 TaxID=2663807 RepID=UPI00178914BD